MEHQQRGFTLIELMIVVAVIAILAGIAYPSYTSYVRRGNRSAAEQLMLTISNREEQYLLDARQYAGTFDSSGLNLSGSQDFICSATNCSNSFYNISVNAAAGPPPSYTITATSIRTQVSEGNLTLTNTGGRTGKW